MVSPPLLVEPKLHSGWMVCDLLTSSGALRWYLVLGVLYGGYALTASVYRQADELFDDMELALEAERPIRTRRELSETPLIGFFFQAVCDASDFVTFNGGLVRRYLPAVPAVLVLPTALGAVSTARSLMALPTAMMALATAARI